MEDSSLLPQEFSLLRKELEKIADQRFRRGRVHRPRTLDTHPTHHATPRLRTNEHVKRITHHLQLLSPLSCLGSGGAFTLEPSKSQTHPPLLLVIDENAERVPSRRDGRVGDIDDGTK